MIVGEEKLRSLTQHVWETVLRAQAEVSADPGTLGGAPIVTAKVDVLGAWAGSVRLGCSRALARWTAGRMFDQPAESLSEDELRDAVGEMANILGGNVKTLIQGRCRLSLPCVSEGTDDGELSARKAGMVSLWFQCEGGPFVVQLFTESAPA